MDPKLAKALATVYGNYRAAITALGIEESDENCAQVIHHGTALLHLQEAVGVEVANTGRVEKTIDECRNYLEGGA